MIEESSRKFNFPYLDSLRFLAFFGVFGYHSFIYKGNSLDDSFLFNIFHGITRNGNTGVNIFYVLSGFLIFYLLLQERFQTGVVNTGRFYLKRILRIWPLYIICTIYGFALYPIIKHLIHEPFVQNHHLIYYLTFTNNFETQQRFPNCFYLSVLWSIAVEFQFYILAPLIVKYSSQRVFPGVMAGIIIISLFFRMLHVNEYSFLYFNTLSIMSDFAIGGLAAYTLLFKPSLSDRLTALPPLFKKSATIVILLLFFAKKQLFQGTILIVTERVILATGLALIILNLIKKRRRKPIAFIENLGKYTYGFYCYHIIAITTSCYIFDKADIFTTDLARFFATPVLSFILVLIMGYLSYHLFERHFLRLVKTGKPVATAKMAR